MLVVQDQMSDGNSEEDEITERVNVVKRQMDEKEALLKHQQNHANIIAARTFLKMSEQRDSIGSLGGASGRSSLGPDLNEDYVNIYRSEKASVIGTSKMNKGLTEQVIKKNTLDKGRSRP